MIVFDWDDVFTLGSTNGYHACYKLAAHSVGAVVSDTEITETVDRLWGRPHEKVIEVFLGEQKHLILQASRAYEEAIFSDTFLSELSIVDGALDMISRLSKRYTLAIVTGSNMKLLREKIFQKFGVPPVFKHIISSHDLKDESRGKPYPDMLLDVLEREGCGPENAVYIGDAPGDMIMAKFANVLPIAVLTGQLSRDAAEKLGIKNIIDDVALLEDLLNRIDK